MLSVKTFVVIATPIAIIGGILAGLRALRNLGYKKLVEYDPSIIEERKAKERQLFKNIFLKVYAMI